MKQIELTIDVKKKLVRIPAESKEFVPRYLMYMFEYKQIPKEYAIQFTDKKYDNMTAFLETKRED